MKMHISRWIMFLLMSDEYMSTSVSRLPRSDGRAKVTTSACYCNDCVQDHI